MESFCICLLKKRGFIRKYYQYPGENFAFCKKLMKKTKKREMLYIKRDGFDLHYLYTLSLSDGNMIGIYFTSKFLCKKINHLLVSIKAQLKMLIIKELGIVRKIKEKKDLIIAETKSFTKKRVNFDIFLSENKIDFRGTRIPVESLCISTDTVVECDYEVEGSDWIIRQIMSGYQQLHIILDNQDARYGVKFTNIPGNILSPSWARYVKID